MRNKSNLSIIICVVLGELALMLIGNLLVLHALKGDNDRLYRVETERVATRIKNGDIPAASEYGYIDSITVFDPDERTNGEYVVAQADDGTYYRIIYHEEKEKNAVLPVMNIIFALVIIITVLVFVYISVKIIRPFRDISELPFELAKGNLTVPVNEEKNRYFGRFLWGMDVLREHIEEEKERRLAMEREKKTLILTLSHDIKTPLSAIKLYNKALSGRLYDTEEKKQEAYAGIEKNADELEAYVEDIRHAVREDFLRIEVKEEEWYMSETIKSLRSLYKEKTVQLRTEFIVDDYDDCIIKGDKDRALEVLQNLMENAIKYGDGKRITISFADEEDCRLVTVSNTGSSFDKKELPNIFDSFYRGSNAAKQKGSGLGLYISRSLMRAMEGDIYAEAVGDTFSVTAVFRR